MNARKLTRTFKGKFMAESRLTTRGRTTVPADLRKALAVKPGTRLVWHVMPDGRVLVRAKSKSFLELAGAVVSPVQGVTIEAPLRRRWTPSTPFCSEMTALALSIARRHCCALEVAS